LIPSLLQPGLLQNTIQSTARDVKAFFAGNCDGSRLFRMFELTVTAFGSRQVPSIVLKKFNDLLYFHDEDNKFYETEEATVTRLLARFGAILMHRGSE